MTRSDVVRRVIGVALLCLSGSAVWARLLGWPATLTRILPLVALVCLAYAVGIIGGARVSRGRGALLAVFVTIVGSMLAGAFTLPDTQGREPLQVYTDSLVQWLGTLLGSTVPALVTPDTVTATVIVSAYLTLIACLMVTTGKPALALLPTGEEQLHSESAEHRIAGGMLDREARRWLHLVEHRQPLLRRLTHFGAALDQRALVLS